MKRFIFMLLTAVGLGLIVGGVSFTPTEPFDPAHVLEHALRAKSGEQGVAEMNQFMQLMMQHSQSLLEDGRSREQREIFKGVSAALKGFGTAFLVFGLLGLVLPLLKNRGPKAPPIASASVP